MIKSAPLLTVAIPTFNGAKTLALCIESVLLQSISFLNAQEIEIILVDNASNKDNEQVVSSLIAKWGGLVRYFRSGTNCGYDRNIDLIHKLARGKFVKILCDDDELYPGALAAHLNAIRDYPDAGIFVCNFDVYDGAMKQILNRMTLCNDENRYFKSAPDFLSSVKGRYGQTSTLMTSREIWNSIDVEPSIGSLHIQVFMAIRIAQKSPAVVLAKPWVKVRTGSPNFSAYPETMYEVPLKTLKILSEFAEADAHPIYKNLLNEQRLYVLEAMRKFHNLNGLDGKAMNLYHELSATLSQRE